MTNRISIVMCGFFLAAICGTTRSQTPQMPQMPSNLEVPRVPPKIEEIKRREAAVRAKALEAVQAGASWSFPITSLDRSLNGRTVTVTLTEKATEARVFDVEVDASPPKEVVIYDHEAPWFVPIVTGEGTFTIWSVSAPAEAIGGKPMTWSRSENDYVIEYGRPVRSSSRVTFISTSLARPACVVPAGTFKCVVITMKQRTGVVETTTWLHSETPAALYYQMKRPKPKTGVITFKLNSRKAADRRNAKELFLEQRDALVNSVDRVH